MKYSIVISLMASDDESGDWIIEDAEFGGTGGNSFSGDKAERIYREARVLLADRCPKQLG